MSGDISEKLSRPDSKAGRLQRACLNLYLEHLRDGALCEDRRSFPSSSTRSRSSRLATFSLSAYSPSSAW